MSNIGYVYILRNPAMEGIFKIGKADDVQKRINELSSSTGVPMPFECEFAMKVENPY